MKNLIIILIFSFIFSNKSFANDIKLFYIEEMRIGESALLYFSKEEIEKGRQPQQYPGSDRYIISNISQHKNFKKFAQIQINYLKNDGNYKMGGIMGSAPYDDIKECLKDKDITENNMDKALKDPVKESAKQDKHYDPTGNSKTYITQYFLENGFAQITCDDWSEKLTKEQNLQDALSVNLIGEDFGNFLKTEAY